MNPAAARLQCLKLAVEYGSLESAKIKGADEILKTAQKWGDFVIGPAVRESKNSGQQGADDHRAKRPVTRSP